MKIKPFGVERWMDLYETTCRYNLAETCVDSISIEQLDKLIDDGQRTVDLFYSRRLTYGDIPGLPEFREGIASLYRDVSKDHILTTNGAIGANFLALYTMIEPGDEVISIIPTYQQHYSIPESLGADVKILQLHPENGFLPDLSKLRSMVTAKTKMICLNNPNNPTGALLPENELMKIVEIASSVDAYILCDEVYRHLNHNVGYAPSIVDLYDKGISTSSMSKVFSLAGLRLGWIVAPLDVIEKVYDMRHYNIISCGMIDEMIGARALAHKDKILERNIQIVQKNSMILDRFVQEEPHIHYVKPKAGTTALIYYDMDLSSTDLCHDMMEKNGLMMVPGDCFDMGKCLRVGYAFNSEDLEEGLAVFKSYLRQYD